MLVSEGKIVFFLEYLRVSLPQGVFLYTAYKEFYYLNFQYVFSSSEFKNETLLNSLSRKKCPEEISVDFNVV